MLSPRRSGKSGRNEKASRTHSVGLFHIGAVVGQIRSGSERQGYTDQMSQELIGIIVAAIALSGIIVTGQWGLRRDIAALGESTRKDIAAMGESTRKDIAALGERVGKVELGLVDRIGKLETSLVERIARLEVVTEGFIKPQSTPQ